MDSASYGRESKDGSEEIVWKGFAKRIVGVSFNAKQLVEMSVLLFDPPDQAPQHVDLVSTFEG